MSGAAQTARMVLRAPEARAPVPVPVPERPRPAPVPVSQPAEAAEVEAERVAQAVLAQPPRPRMQRSPAPASLTVARAPSPVGPVPVPYPNLGLGGGRPLPRALRRDMEPRFGGADFSAVRIHTGATAARASRRLNAAAFTAGSHIAFGRGRFRPERAEGRRLIAHELTHTIQQRGATQPATVQRSVDTTVRTRSAPRVMRLGVQDALDHFADKAALLPGFTMLTLLLGFNPVNLRRVERSAPNLLRALVQMLPGGALITQALDNHGIVERVANWVSARLSALGDIGASIRDSIDRFLDGLSWTDIFDLGGLWARARSIVTTPIARIVAFARGLIVDIVDFIKDAILRPLAALAEGTRGYPLLRAVLGFDPITGDPAERSPSTLIGGFMTLIGQEEVWLNLQRANAVPRAWAWFQGALEGLVGFVRQIPTLYVNAFRALGLIDIVVLPRAFAKVVGVFAGFYVRFFRWAGGTVVDLLEIIFAVVAPGVMPYLRRAGAAFVSVLRNPIAFGRNLVLALKAGFTRFAANFLRHLTAGIIDWLTGSLPGVHIPQSLSLQEILKFVLSVLGLSWAQLRAKLVRKVGEPAVVAMEKGFEIVKKLVTEGPVAAWEQLKTSLADLKQMAIDAIVAMVTEFVVVKAIPKLIALFIPGPGFITAAIAIYDTIMTFIRQLGRIAALVKSYLDAFMAIASGVIDAAAGRIEAAAARYLSLIVSILAGMLGFGKVADRVRAVLEKIRRPIDRAMDKVVDWVLRLGRRFVAGVKSGARRLLQWWRKKRRIGEGERRHTLQFDGDERSARLMVHSAPVTPAVFVSAFSTVKGTDAQRAEVTRAQGEIDRLKVALLAAQAAPTPDEARIAALDQQLDEEFHKLGDALATILDRAAGAGGQDDPLPIDYPKRRAAAYPPIRVGPESTQRIAQDALKALPPSGAKAAMQHAMPSLAGEPGFKAWDGQVRTYTADGGADQALPNGRTVGLSAQFASLAPGVRLRYDDKGSTGGGGKINKLFEPYGFSASKEGLDGDHVMERQIGGPDEVANLWPLPRGENRSSGALVKTLSVVYGGEAMPVHVARQRRGQALYLLIRSVRTD